MCGNNKGVVIVNVVVWDIVKFLSGTCDRGGDWAARLTTIFNSITYK